MAELASTSLFSDANLKAYYKLESGALTTDSSGNGKTLTNNNTVGEGSGQFGVCADFGTANTNKSLSIVDAFGITSGACSISAWVKIRTDIGDGATWFLVAAENSTSDILYGLQYYRVGSTRTVGFTRYRQGTSTDQVTYNVDLGTSNWHHVVMTYDGSNLRGYYNGTLVVGPTAYSGTGTGVTADSFAIGNSRGTASGNGLHASAFIDDVAIFNRELTAGEILDLYNNRTGYISILN